MGWSKAQIWQDGTYITANTFQPGTLGSLEYDHDIPDDEFFATEFGGTIEPPPPTGDTMELATLNQGLNIRNGVGTVGTTVLFTAKSGDQIVGHHETGHTWYVIDWMIIDGVQYDPPVQAYCSSWEGYYSSQIPYVPPTTTPSIFITHEFNDTLSIDGVVYEGNFTVENVEYKPKA